MKTPTYTQKDAQTNLHVQTHRHTSTNSFLSFLFLHIIHPPLPPAVTLLPLFFPYSLCLSPLCLLLLYPCQHIPLSLSPSLFFSLSLPPSIPLSPPLCLSHS